MLVQMGRYGDTRVETRMLFDARDPACTGPPADAIDVQFRPPLTVSLLLERYLDGPGVVPVVEFLGASYREVVAATVNKLQFVAGYVADGSLSWPARLEVATAAHLYNNDDETDIRLHHHLWVGRTAVALHDRVRRPVDLDGMRLSLTNVVWSTYLRTLHTVTTRDLGVSWRSPRPGAGAEITDPPMHVGLTGQEDLGICTTPWGPRETWAQPTPAKLAFQAQQEREAAAALAQGRYSWVPPDQPRPPSYLDEPDSW
ncbi:hypothetical protein [Pseudonocardia broussonetiae]|uniref:Uncharacterized protein n=1 Tax=Pseudonocardia broussonetiae TaxID=2736640 RepID=A0A6M6JW06_9PSEU|nr:hypothetical protein [Pseudonocardia broussonetiae]QJY51186.1 hypothetical protein HOP40_34975 [Pseudonocardia broussonetiae]